MLHVGEGGGKAKAMGEVGRCPRESPGPGTDAALIVSVAIGEVAAESRMMGVRGDPKSVGAETLRVATEIEFLFAAVDLVVGIMVFWRGLAGIRGSGDHGRGKGEERIFNFVAGFTLRVGLLRGKKKSVLFCK